MAYCALDDLKQHILDKDIAQITDDAAGKNIDQSKVSAMAQKAQDIIDGYLRGRYSLPLNSVPPLIISIACDLTIYFLYERRFGLNTPEALQRRYDNAIKLLKAIQSGMVLLGIESNETGPGAGQYKINKTKKDRIFSRDMLDDY
jgi:phage gp36-like protein